MESTFARSGRGMTDGSLLPCLDAKQIFFTNLQLLGFDAAAMEMKYKIPFNKDMFNLPNKAGAEAVLYFLFDRLNHALCQQEFRDCWPVTDKKTEAMFRKICCIWLQNIQKEETDAKLPRINATLFLSPGGDKFNQLLFSFSTYVVLHTIRTEHGIKDFQPLGYPTLTTQNKELGSVMEKTCNCAAIRHRKHFFQTLRQTVSAKQSWQTYADEVTRSVRSLTKDVRELERESREQVQEAARSGVARGSPIPASRLPHDFDLSEHTTRRALRVQQVRDLWRGVEGFMDRTQEDVDIVSSIVDRTQQKYSIDAANIKISIPHLMLRECEQEIRRRQVDNIYEGGDLNLVSVLQLWNLALKMYTQRLNNSGLVDLSHAAENMRSQAHTHQAYLANTKALREKMEKDVPRRKKVIEHLRKEFCSIAPSSGLEMTAPSPPVSFDPPRGHSGATPTGPVLQLTPDFVDTPDAAVGIAKSVLQSSRKNVAEPYQTTVFGMTAAGTLNRNNSNRLPQPKQQSNICPKPSKQTSKSAMGTRGSSSIQPRVVRHISGKLTSTTTSVAKGPPSSTTKKGVMASNQQRASTPKRPPSSHREDLDRTPVPSDFNNSATETPRQRAHDILADKIVWAVMHGEEDAGIDEAYRLGLERLHQSSSATKSAGLSTTSTSHASSVTPSKRPAASIVPRVQPTMLFSSEQLTPSYRTLVDTQQKTRVASSQKQNGDSDRDLFGTARSPVTLVQQAKTLEAEQGSDSEGSLLASQRWAKRTQADGEGQNEDFNVQNPITALGQDAFVSHDLIHRSPLAFDIRRMWQDAVSESEDTENPDSMSNKKLAEDWLDEDGSSSTHTLTQLTQRTLDSASSSPRPLLQNLKKKQMFNQSGADEDNVNEHRMPEDPHLMNRKEELAFSTSFDEDPLLEDFTKVDHSIVESEEHMSALYDDYNDIVEDENTRREKLTTDDVVAFNSTLDSLFQTRSPACSQRKVTKTDGPAGGEASACERNPDLPLISFTPEHPAQPDSNRRTDSELASSSPFPLSAKAVEASGNGTNVRVGSQRRAEFELSAGAMQSSPEGASDKENLSSPLQQSIKGGLSQSSSNSRSSPKVAPLKRVTFSPESSPCGKNKAPDLLQDELLDDDDIFNIQGTSLNESFTPLRTGMFVQGKSPGRVTLSTKDAFPESSTNGNKPAYDSLASDNLEVNLAAQLSRLRKLTDEALATERPATVGREWKLSDSASNPLDIFAEDDSVLVPASP